MADDPALTGLHQTPSGVASLNGQNAYYLVQILSSRYGLVNAWLPNTFQFNLEQSWKNIIGGGAPEIINAIMEMATGRNVYSQYLTARVWTGSNPLAFRLPLHFVARRSSQGEVIKPIKQLMKMSLPVRSGSWTVFPPGPSVIHQAAEQLLGWADTHSDNITLYIGNYIRIPNVYISNVEVSFDGLLNKDGEPMSGDVMIQCATLYMPTSNEVDKWLPDNKGDIVDRPNWETGRIGNNPRPGGPV